MIQPVDAYQWKRSPVCDARAEVVVQADLQALEHHPAVAVDDRLRQAGGAARIDDPERVVERQPGRRERRVVGDQRVEVVRRARRPGERADVGLGVEVAQQHRVAHARQLVDQAAQHRQAVGGDAAVDVAVDADHDLGLDLAEAVEDRQRPHVGRAHRPDRAQAGAGEEGDRGLRQVGQDRARPGRRGTTPMRASAAANDATWRRSSGQAISSVSPCACIASSRKTIAGWPAASLRSAWRNTCCA